MKKDPQRASAGSNKEFMSDLNKAYKGKGKKKKMSANNPLAYGPAMSRAFAGAKGFGAPNAGAMKAGPNPSWVKQKGAKKGKDAKKKVSNVLQKKCKACKVAHPAGKHVAAKGSKKNL